jgi:hypothetical protein
MTDETKCRIYYNNGEDCPNQDGSYLDTDICPIDGERCIVGLEPECYDTTLFPTRIRKEHGART